MISGTYIIYMRKERPAAGGPRKQMKATVRKPNKEETNFMQTCETWEHEAGKFDWEYKEKQEKNIERLAVKLAKDVVKTGIEVKMDRMNSYERRLVHNRLSNFKGVTTISEGEEPNRCVVIKPVEK